VYRDALLTPYHLAISHANIIAELKDSIAPPTKPDNPDSDPTSSETKGGKGKTPVIQDTKTNNNHTGFGIKGRILSNESEMASLSLGDIRDICFLPGYAQPCVLILHENRPTCVGRYAVLENSTSLKQNL